MKSLLTCFSIRTIKRNFFCSNLVTYNENCTGWSYFLCWVYYVQQVLCDGVVSGWTAACCTTTQPDQCQTPPMHSRCGDVKDNEGVCMAVSGCGLAEFRFVKICTCRLFDLHAQTDRWLLLPIHGSAFVVLYFTCHAKRGILLSSLLRAEFYGHGCQTLMQRNQR